jgi:hypothetical protein
MLGVELIISVLYQVIGFLFLFLNIKVAKTEGSFAAFSLS